MNASAHEHVVRRLGAQQHAMRRQVGAPDGGEVWRSGGGCLRPVGLATLCRTVRRACSAVDVRALIGLVGDLAERAAVARVYAHFFPGAWKGELESGGESLLRSTRAACALVARLVEHIARADMFPIEEWALDDLQLAAGDDTDEVPRALSFIPLYPAFGFEWEPYDNGEEQASAGLLVLMALLISDSGLGDVLSETLRTEAEQETAGSDRGEDGGAARAARRWKDAQVVLDRVTTSEQVAALFADTGAAFARLGEPWASVPLLASYLVADTPNGYLNLTAESWGGAEDYTWTVENVHLLAAEWTEAKALLPRIGAAMAVLAQPGAVDILVASLTETFDLHDPARESVAASTAASPLNS